MPEPAARIRASPFRPGKMPNLDRKPRYAGDPFIKRSKFQLKAVLDVRTGDGIWRRGVLFALCTTLTRPRNVTGRRSRLPAMSNGRRFLSSHRVGESFRQAQARQGRPHRTTPLSYPRRFAPAALGRRERSQPVPDTQPIFATAQETTFAWRGRSSATLQPDGGTRVSRYERLGLTAELRAAAESGAPAI
jgi:hypothetical protein